METKEFQFHNLIQNVTTIYFLNVMTVMTSSVRANPYMPPGTKHNTASGFLVYSLPCRMPINKYQVF